MLRYLPVRRIHARQVLDSRGTPTVEVEATVGEGIIQIGAGLAALEQQLVIWDLRSPHNSGIRAAELHLFHVQITAVGKVKLFHAIKSFLKGIPFHHHKTAEAVWCSW